MQMRTFLAVNIPPLKVTEAALVAEGLRFVTFGGLDNEEDAATHSDLYQFDLLNDTLKEIEAVNVMENHLDAEVVLRQYIANERRKRASTDGANEGRRACQGGGEVDRQRGRIRRATLLTDQEEGPGRRKRW